MFSLWRPNQLDPAVEGATLIGLVARNGCEGQSTILFLFLFAMVFSSSESQPETELKNQNSAVIHLELSQGGRLG